MSRLPATGDLADGNFYEIARDRVEEFDPNNALTDSMEYEGIQTVEQDGVAVRITTWDDENYLLRLRDRDQAYRFVITLNVALAHLGLRPDVVARVENYDSPKEYRRAAPGMAQAGWRVVSVSDTTSHGGCLSFLLLGWLGVIALKKRSVTVTFEASLRSFTIEGWESPRRRLKPTKRHRRPLADRHEGQG